MKRPLDYGIVIDWIRSILPRFHRIIHLHRWHVNTNGLRLRFSTYPVRL